MWNKIRGVMDRVKLAHWFAMGLGAALWWFFSGPLQWLGIALVVSTALGRASAGSDESHRVGWIPRSVKSWIFPILLTAVIVAQCWPWFLGHMSLRGDHPIHLFKAWVLWERLLPDLDIMGWSHDLHAGYPANMLYPPGVDLWICLYRVLTLGLFDWMTTYAHAFALAMWFSTLAIYSLGVRLVGRGAAFIGTLLFVLDKGGFNEGGWSFSIVDGVWGQLLALAFGCLGIRSLVTLYGLGSVVDVPPSSSSVVQAVFSAAGYGAVACLCHPNGLLFVVITYGIAVIMAAVSQLHKLPSVLLLGGAVAALLSACCAFFYVPLMGFGDYLFNLADAPQTTAALAERALDGTFFRHTLGLPVFLGLWGAVLALVTRRQGAMFCAAILGVFVALSMTHVVIELRLFDIHPFFAKLDYRRFLFMAKLPLFLLAGTALVIVWTQIRTKPNGDSHWKTLAPVFLASLCLAPLVAPMVETLRDSGESKVRFAEDEWDWPALVSFFEYAKTLNDGQPYRIAYVDDHDLHTWGVVPPLNGHPMYKVGFMPVDTFSGRFSVWDPETFRKLGVRYAVTRRKSDNNHIGFQLIKTFAAPKGPPVLVFELNDFRFEPWEVVGSAAVELVEWEREQVVLNVSQVTPGDKVTLRVAYFPGWTATLNGQPLAVEPTVYDPRMAVRLMTVSPSEDGLLRFEWNKSPVQRTTGWLSALFWVLVIPMSIRPTLFPVTWVNRPRFLRVFEWATIGAVILMVFLLGWFYWFSPPGRIEGVHTQWSFLDHLGDAEVWLEDERSGEIEACDRPSLGRWMCSLDPKRDWNYVGPHVGNIGGLRACIWAHPSERRILRIRFPDVPLGQMIVGRHEILGAAKGADVTLAVQVGHEEIGQLVKSDVSETFFELSTSRFDSSSQDVTFSVTAPKSGARHYCFEAYVGEKE
ncbi:MAG: hypothetical protein HUU55_02665 [Myxococcales bacterium]|nr:hypothetical protein [Myxococcales bacterium]